jgi:hypothetical protein
MQDHMLEPELGLELEHTLELDHMQEQAHMVAHKPEQGVPAHQGAERR